MTITIILTITGCILLFLMILDATLTLPSSSLIKYFPEDVQKKLKSRLENLPLTPKRIAGCIILVLLGLAWLALFFVGGFLGRADRFTFINHLIRFLIIGFGIKLFDIVCLDFILLTKTKFFQHFFPETKDCKGWHQFGYNRKQQIKQCVSIFIFCIAMTAGFTFL